jgi:hypothetical protein
MILGFTWGGWVTGGTADEMATNAREEARAELAASVCVAKFMQAPDATAQLAALKEASSWQRDDFITKGEWTTLVGSDEPVDGAADLCAEQLAEMEAPAAAASETTAAQAETTVN